MAELISTIWAGLRDAGIPEVMLYLPDNSASRCHWDDTAIVGEVRVALLADQDRQIVRILPVDSCVGIGVASPKGTDPSGYRRFVQNRLNKGTGGVEDVADESEPVVKPAPPAPPVHEPPPPAPAAEPPKPDPVTSRWGIALKPASRFGAAGIGGR